MTYYFEINEESGTGKEWAETYVEATSVSDATQKIAKMFGREPTYIELLVE